LISKDHRLRIVKNTGDDSLVEFASVVDAVRGAAEIQRDIAEQNADVPQIKRIEFRPSPSASIRACEQVIFTAQRDRPDRAIDSVGVEFNAARRK